MKREAENEQLLQDVLGEASPADFRQAMLSETVRLAAQRRRSRRLRQAGVLAVALMAVLTSILTWQHSLRPPRVAERGVQHAIRKNYTLIHSRPFPPIAIITTQPLVQQRVAILDRLKIVETSPGNFHPINDRELLALLGPRPAILIRTGPNSAELVFASSDEQQTN